MDKFDKMFKHCYVNNLEVKINTLNKGIDKLLKKYEDDLSVCKTYPEVGSNKVVGLVLESNIQDLKRLKGE